MQKYVKFLKTNTDDDYSGILTLLRFKLEMVRNCLTERLSMDQERHDMINTQFLYVEMLLERVINETRFNELYLEYKKRYGEVEYRGEKRRMSSLEAFKMIFHVPEEKEIEARYEFVKLIEQAEQAKKMELKKALEAMSDSIWDWWVPDGELV